MTDRELLELAAKAAGIDVGHSTRFPDNTLFLNEQGLLINWNPLTDDGDALRLAVKLGLDVCIDTPHEDEPRTHVIGFIRDGSTERVTVIEYHGDPYAVTRRAIVGAAAEIGKQDA